MHATHDCKCPSGTQSRIEVIEKGFNPAGTNLGPGNLQWSATVEFPMCSARPLSCFIAVDENIFCKSQHASKRSAKLLIYRTVLLIDLCFS